MDRISKIAEKVGREAGLAARVASSGFTMEAEKNWKEFVEWVSDRFRSEKFVTKERRTGDAIWEKTLSAGADRLAMFETRGWDDRRSFEFLVWGDNDYAKIQGKNYGEVPTLAEMQAALDQMLAKSPVKMQKFEAKGLTPKAAEKMKVLVDSAIATVKEMIPAADFSGPWESGDVGSSYKLRLERDGAFMILEVEAKEGRGMFVVSALGNDLVREKYFDLDSLAKGLKATKRLVSDGLKKLDKFTAGMLTGKVTIDALVKKVESVTARFEVVDEWVMTDLEIKLKLATSAPVERSMVEKWAERNWSQVMAKAPSKTPAAPSGRGMEHDEPSGHVSYPVPNRLRWESRESVDWSQQGDGGVLKVSVSDR